MEIVNTEISAKDAHKLESIPIPPEYKNKKLYCRVWDENGVRTLGKAKSVPYGKPFFIISVGGRKRYFKINYYTKGMIKQIDNKMYYDTAFDNTVGGFALRNYEFPEDMDSDEAYTVFEYNAVRMYVARGGIPLYYLLIAMGIALVAFIAIIATVPSGLSAQDQVKELDTLVTALRQENAVLKAQNEELRTNGG